MKVSKTILLVEDDQDDQEFFMLALEGIENISLYGIANNGREALQQLQNATELPDLVFSDINMPLMNGMEYLLEMGNNLRTRNIPIVIISTSSNNKALLLGLGARAFIEKPTDPASLHNALKQLLLQDLEVSK